MNFMVTRFCAVKLKKEGTHRDCAVIKSTRDESRHKIHSVLFSWIHVISGGFFSIQILRMNVVYLSIFTVLCRFASSEGRWVKWFVYLSYYL